MAQDEASIAGASVVTPMEVLSTHLMETVKSQLPALLTLGSLQRLMQELRGLNPRCPIVVTRGAAGATLYHSAGRVDLPAPPVQVADTVGAGDSLCAGLLGLAGLGLGSNGAH